MAATSKRRKLALIGGQGISRWQHLDRVLEVDQTPIGKTPRSCPATYVGFWDDIRKLFASTEEARLRGYSARRFSFNTSDGRCPACEGQGMKRIEMSFLPGVSVPCELCAGDPFTPETLSVTWGGKNIGEVLKMSGLRVPGTVYRSASGEQSIGPRATGAGIPMSSGDSILNVRL